MIEGLARVRGEFDALVEFRDKRLGVEETRACLIHSTCTLFLLLVKIGIMVFKWCVITKDPSIPKSI